MNFQCLETLLECRTSSTTMYLMKNDKQIAFTKLSYQPFSGNFVTVVQYQKPISWNV